MNDYSYGFEYKYTDFFCDLEVIIIFLNSSPFQFIPFPLNHFVFRRK